MSPEDGYQCVYCGISHPKVTQSRKKTAGIKTLFVATVEEETQIPPIIECPLCKRKYLLLVEDSNHRFIERFTNNMKYSDTVLGSMASYNIELGDIPNGFLGLTEPTTLFSSVKNLTYSDQHHVVFEKENCTYFILITKTDEGYLANSMEIAL